MFSARPFLVTVKYWKNGAPLSSSGRDTAVGRADLGQVLELWPWRTYTYGDK